MVGSNKDEYALYAREHPLIGKMTEAQLREDLLPDYGANTDALIAAYKQSRPQASPWDLMVAIRSNRFHIGTVRLAEAASKTSPVYVYSFDFEPSPLKAAHGSEIAFVFSNATASPTARPGAKAVEDAMSEAWIAFARTGNPNHAGLPTWPTYDAQNRATMVFDTAIEGRQRSACARAQGVGGRGTRTLTDQADNKARKRSLASGPISEVCSAPGNVPSDTSRTNCRAAVTTSCATFG